ncbi:MAG: bifunctional phosphoglucose/phosphomannose isomerase [candidate division NC10 bacterium]|nr:bifunctional phosphoglucose/phosphomannose isomerase [candidate division NC10 bacterium]
MTLDDVRAVDPSGMYDILVRFPAQVEEALAIGRAARLPRPPRGITSIVLTGLGGSAIAGDLLRSYLAGKLDVPLIVNRHYTLPAFVGRGTLVLVSSYSGNTEETNAAHRAAERRGAKILCISSGGITSTLAARHGRPLIRIPGGLPPRGALGYSFFPLLLALTRMGFVPSRAREIAETVALLRAQAKAFSDPASEGNPAAAIAEMLNRRIGIIYAAADLLEPVATRWRGQLEENAKTLAFSHILPEMNHNEIVGWQVLTGAMKEMQVIFLRDSEDHPRVQTRIDVTRSLLLPYTGRITEVWSQGVGRLARMFSLVQLADWVSLYLAAAHGVDPMPVAAIDRLKKALADT